MRYLGIVKAHEALLALLLRVTDELCCGCRARHAQQRWCAALSTGLQQLRQFSEALHTAGGA